MGRHDANILHSRLQHYTSDDGKRDITHVTTPSQMLAFFAWATSRHNPMGTHGLDSGRTTPRPSAVDTWRRPLHVLTCPLRWPAIAQRAYWACEQTGCFARGYESGNRMTGNTLGDILGEASDVKGDQWACALAGTATIRTLLYATLLSRLSANYKGEPYATPTPGWHRSGPLRMGRSMPPCMSPVVCHNAHLLSERHATHQMHMHCGRLPSCKLTV